MIKKIAATGSVVALGLTLAACSAESADAENNELVLYSTMTENDLNVMMGLLEDEFPDISIELVNGSAGELTTRIRSEASNPQGDMMWGGLDTLDGDAHSDIFEHWLSDYEDDVLEDYRSPNGFYNVDHLSTVAFAVNTEIEADLGLEINGYEDLLDPALSGRILMADPTSSSSAWNNLSNIMAVYGYDTDETWDYLRNLLENDLIIASSSSAPFASVADGEYAVGMTYEDGIAPLIESGADNIRLVYPEEGTSASAFSTAVIEGAPNADLAKDVVNYIMSPEGQIAFGEAVGTVRMVTEAEYESEFLPAYDTVNWVERDVDWLIENRDSVIDGWVDLYTELRGS